MIKKVCGTCVESRKNGPSTVYCKLFGIVISREYERQCHRFLKGEKDANKVPQQEG